MPKEYSEIKSNVKKSHSDWTDEKVSEVAAKIFGSVFGTNPQHAEKLSSEGKWEDYKRSHAKKGKKEQPLFFSYVTGVELKEDEGKLYAEGFLSDSDEDIGHDIVADQQKLVGKYNSGSVPATKLSWRHDWLKNPEYREIPFGTLEGPVELRKNPISGNMAAWGRYKLNPAYPDFQDKVKQIREGHVNGFSIEYEAAHDGVQYETLGNIRRRHLNEYSILGTGLAARPMQQNAVMTGFYAKEYEMKDEEEDQDEEEDEKKKDGDEKDDEEDDGKKDEKSKESAVGKHDHLPDGQFDQGQLEKGIQTEMEHTNDAKLAKSIAKDHLVEDPFYYDHLEKFEEQYGIKGGCNPEKSKESHANLGSAAARQETANRQGGNPMEGKEAELQKQLDQERAQKKELEQKLAALEPELKEIKEFKEDYAKFKDEHGKVVLANAEAKEAEKKTAEAKELETKEFDRKMTEYKEKPTWEGASALLRDVGGPLRAG